jgi:hypothetical protein
MSGVCIDTRNLTDSTNKLAESVNFNFVSPVRPSIETYAYSLPTESGGTPTSWSDV